MQGVYQQLIELLGKANDDPAFARFIEEIGEMPVIDDRKRHSFYLFPRTGFTILAHSEHPGTKYLWSVVFFIDDPDVQAGFFQRCSGQFIAVAKDSMADVQRKIDLVPIDWYAAEDLKLHYDLTDYTLDFFFHEPDGDKMALVSLTKK